MTDRQAEIDAATDVVEKCAIAASLADNSHNGEPFAQNYRNMARAIIDALADGVSERMVEDACRTYWESINCDGWSWQEMREGTAGNNQRDREVALEHASDIAVAMHAALSAAIPRPARLAISSTPLYEMTFRAQTHAIPKDSGKDNPTT